jgi:hypothetical protein
MQLQRLTIRAALLGASILLVSTGARAQLGASEATNFEIGVESSDSDTSDSTSSGTLGGRLKATIPLGTYFAASISGDYSETKVRTRDVLAEAIGSLSGVRPSCDFDSTNGEVTLFARRPTLGKIGVSYGVGSLGSDCGANSQFLITGNEKLSTEGYRVEAEYYFHDFTLAAARTSTELEDGPKLESTSVTASWYPHDSLRISVSGNDLYDQDNYGIRFEHQPDFLGDAFGVHVGYARTDQDPKTRTINLGLIYYFGTRVELKVRDRQYR